jgi:adenosylhomocysteine nucleosidase
MKIGIIVAMDKELILLKALFSDLYTEHFHHKDFFIGYIGQHQVILQKCGIGKVNSTIGTVEMINHYQTDLIISSGCAGGADPSLNIGDVVVSTACAYHDAYCGSECDFGQIAGMPARFKSSEDIVKKASSLDAKENIKPGLIVSGEWFVDSQKKIRSILDHFPEALAVDMESCSIAQTCYVYDIPFISFRIISDVPLKDSKAQMYFDFWDKMAEGSFDVTKSFLNAIG